MRDNPFKDERVEKLLETIGIASKDYQWLFEIGEDRSVDKNQGSVDVYSETQTSQEMIDLLKKSNNGFPVNATKNKVDWQTGDLIRFYVSFNDVGEWRIK